tara:strand:+ start:562 stop:729 length:168 start_codon:yes stop_codon:yes gene_type:complete
MSPELLIKRENLVIVKSYFKNRVAVASSRLDEAAENLAHADMALKEFERKRGGDV